VTSNELKSYIAKLRKGKEDFNVVKKNIMNLNNIIDLSRHDLSDQLKELQNLNENVNNCRSEL